MGSYAHRPIVVNPDEIPSNEEASLSPTELPFTQEDFDPQLGEALELTPLRHRLSLRSRATRLSTNTRSANSSSPAAASSRVSPR